MSGIAAAGVGTADDDLICSDTATSAPQHDVAIEPHMARPPHIQDAHHDDTVAATLHAGLRRALRAARQ
jgi:hypothetical protein